MAPDETRTEDPADIRDELPAELDASGLVGPYLFPNTSRRRIAGLLYLAVAAVAIVFVVVADGSPRVNGGLLLGALALLVVGVHHLATGWNTAVDETDALVAAAEVVGFAPGPASAQMTWRGWTSRPTWRLLVYSHELPPAKRALVLVDGIDGRVLEHFVEDNPEDWAEQ